MTIQHNDYDIAAQKIINYLDKNIVLGVPLGLGKPVGLLNALYREACKDKSIKMTIITGLTLARPQYTNELEKRLAEPILERLIKDYEDPLYEKDRVLQKMPNNINVIEFFLTTAKYVHNNYVQQNYISSIYTGVVHDALHYNINIYAQQVARSTKNSQQYSLSCNADLFPEISQDLLKMKKNGKKIILAAEVNQNLPFMLGKDAIVNTGIFTDIIDTGNYRALFALPRDELSPQDHLIGLYTSSLIKDNGCLQIGIGKLSNAVASALIMRHKDNTSYQELMKVLAVKKKFGHTVEHSGSLSTFEKGLYAPTEMLSDEYMHLYNNDILKRRVYDHLGLQKLLNENKISEEITSKTLDVLLEHKIIRHKLTKSNVKFLKKFGIFNDSINYERGYLTLSSGEKILADLSLNKSKETIIKNFLGENLKTGKIIHAGFFLGGINLYRQLKDLSEEEREQMEMTSIQKTNTLDFSHKLLLQQRQYTRFVNSCMMVTLGGAIVSDGLENLREISGVGGQFDFVSMAMKLKDSRSIITCRSTRKTKKGVASNIIWDYANQTISRYLRDIVITEYGIADCKSKTDSETIKSILNITDSRFQDELLQKAKQHGKVPLDYEIPKLFRQNLPEKIFPVIHEMQLKGYCKPFPFGCDLTEDEVVIEKALLSLKYFNNFKMVITIISALLFFGKKEKVAKYLIRMQLNSPKNMKEYVYKKLLTFAIYKQISN